MPSLPLRPLTMTTNSPLGPVMLDLRGTALTTDEIEKIRHPATGGLIYFTRNYDSPEQLADLTRQIRSLRPEILIAVDHEGGRVQRFRPGFSRIPRANCYAENGAGAAELAELAGWLMAVELRAVDIDFSFAPVLDVDCGISQIIGDRSFSRDADAASAIAAAFRSGMGRAGMAATGKHFPGHGGVALDSHLTLPVDGRILSELEAKDFIPFQRLIAAGLEAIMPAHVVYPAVDDKPAGFSTRWIKDILRDQLKFDGIVFSDDLSMAGAEFAGSYRQRARMALEAGCDMVLVCNQPDAADEVLEELAADVSAERSQRLLRMRGRWPVDRDRLLASAEWQQAAERIQSIGL